MDARRFHNALRIMRSIEGFELQAAGVIDENWGTRGASSRDQLDAFYADPFAEALRMPDANFTRLSALIESRQPKTKPRCSYCDTTEGLRQHHDGGGYIAPDYVCEDCFTPADDGPCFDDLPEAEVA